MSIKALRIASRRMEPEPRRDRNRSPAGRPKETNPYTTVGSSPKKPTFQYTKRITFATTFGEPRLLLALFCTNGFPETPF